MPPCLAPSGYATGRKAGQDGGEPVAPARPGQSTGLIALRRHSAPLAKAGTQTHGVAA